MNRRRLYVVLLAVCGCCLILTAVIEVAGRGSAASVVCTISSAIGVWCATTGLRRNPPGP